MHVSRPQMDIGNTVHSFGFTPTMSLGEASEASFYTSRLSADEIILRIGAPVTVLTHTIAEIA